MFGHKRRQTDVDEEVASPLSLEADRLRDRGVSQAEAETAARRQFGNVATAQERFYEAGHRLWWEQLKRDVIYAGRILSHNPGFTLVSVLSLDQGSGSPSLAFSVDNALRLRSQPLNRAAL